MNAKQSRFVLAISLLSGIVLSTFSAQAAVISVGPGAFPAGSTLLTFGGLADGVEVNGMTAGGILFTYSLGNSNVVIDGGPGTTNNIAPQNIVSVADNTGILTLTFATQSTDSGMVMRFWQWLPLRVRLRLISSAARPMSAPCRTTACRILASPVDLPGFKARFYSTAHN